jgi:thiol-disulfide isomerase/thioredoxin
MKRLTLFLLVLVAAGLLAAAPAFEQSRLKSFERGSWQRILRAHAGRPTLVHFWGVTCGPCKVELPELGEFMKEHRSVDIVTIDADLVPNSDAAAMSMLQGAGLSSAENWMFSDGFAERLRYEVDPAWQGDIPRTILISGKGDIETIEGSAEPSVLQKWSADQVAATK